MNQLFSCSLWGELELPRFLHSKFEDSILKCGYPRTWRCSEQHGSRYAKSILAIILRGKLLLVELSWVVRPVPKSSGFRTKEIEKAWTRIWLHVVKFFRSKDRKDQRVLWTEEVEICHVIWEGRTTRATRTPMLTKFTVSSCRKLLRISQERTDLYDFGVVMGTYWDWVRVEDFPSIGASRFDIFYQAEFILWTW